MANAVTTQTLLDGDRNVVILLTGALDTSNEARAIKVDVSALVPAAALVKVKRIQYVISGALKVLLDWDASTDVTFAVLCGQGEVCAERFGGLLNNAGAGVTGDIYLTTLGYTSGTETYTLILELVKTRAA